MQRSDRAKPRPTQPAEKSRARIHALVMQVEQRLREWGVCEGDGIVVGVSGGPDSVCLLHLLKTISQSFSLKVRIAHLDHGLRGKESGADAKFVEDLAHHWEFPAIIESVSVLPRPKGISLQAAARLARYAFFERAAQKTQSRWIALGHTADDQAETFLLRLLRGAGTQGLSSIPPQRRMVSADGQGPFIIRPLLDVRRKAVLSYLKDQSIPYREDSSNSSPAYLRNRLRREVIPLLISYNPGVVDILCRTAALLRQDHEFLAEQAAQVATGLQVEILESGIALNRQGFKGLHRALQRAVLRDTITRVKGDLMGIGFRHLEDALKLIQSGKPGSRITLPKGIDIHLTYNQFWVHREQGQVDRLQARVLSVPGEVEFPALRLCVRAFLADGPLSSDAKQRAVFDFEKVYSPFIIRGRRRGDFFFPQGMYGKRKKLQDFLVDEKVPRYQRDTIPLLTSSENILWVMGWRLDERYLAGPGSRRVVVVEMSRPFK